MTNFSLKLLLNESGDYLTKNEKMDLALNLVIFVNSKMEKSSYLNLLLGKLESRLSDESGSEIISNLLEQSDWFKLIEIDNFRTFFRNNLSVDDISRFSDFLIEKIIKSRDEIECDKKCFDFVCFCFEMHFCSTDDVEQSCDKFDILLAKFIHHRVNKSDKMGRLVRFRSIAGLNPKMNLALFNVCLDLVDESSDSKYVTFAILQIYFITDESLLLKLIKISLIQGNSFDAVYVFFHLINLVDKNKILNSILAEIDLESFAARAFLEAIEFSN